MLAPRLSARRSVASKDSRTPGSIPEPSSPPSPSSSSGTPIRIPARSCAMGIVNGLAGARCSCCPADPDRPCGQTAAPRVGDIAGERARLVQRRGERDHAVAGTRAVSWLEGRRSHTARPAGGSSRRCRCRSPTAPRRRRPRRRSPPRTRPARGGCPTGCGPVRTPSSRWRTPSRTHPGWSWPAASRRPAEGWRRPWRCRAGGSPRGCASRTGSARPRCRTGP